MAGTEPEVRDFVAPANGVLRVCRDDETREMNLTEGERVTLEWEAA